MNKFWKLGFVDYNDVGWRSATLGWVERTPLRIPKLEANDVKLNGLLVAGRRGDALHHELTLRDKRATRIAPFPATGPPQNRGILSYGSRPSLSLSRIRRRIAGPSMVGYEHTTVATARCSDGRRRYDFSARLSASQT